MERRKQRNRFLIIIVLLLLFFGSWCLNKKSKDSVERNNPKYEIIDDGNNTSTPINCDSVGGRGISFVFPKEIDSVKCNRNGVIDIRLKLHFTEKDSTTEVVLYDTFTYENEYHLTLYYSKVKKEIPIKKILFESVPHYGGYHCDIKSCEFDGNIIFEWGGTFYVGR